ncbi:hypothetical protein BCY88_17555 [Paraburkholderia fungorum]|uniref:Uncharacterized protein n=1 Tax=Paraburkholderia fungorum TaxID=134537 RepID=A0A3R7IC98_9BURK|nr:hypothetical protein BCY88_17555 [Paraburkholderia fungorum]
MSSTNACNSGCTSRESATVSTSIGCGLSRPNVKRKSDQQAAIAATAMLATSTPDTPQTRLSLFDP